MRRIKRVPSLSLSLSSLSSQGERTAFGIDAAGILGLYASFRLATIANDDVTRSRLCARYVWIYRQKISTRR